MGSYLGVIEEIIKVYEPVIEASRGESIWKHGAGGEVGLAHCALGH